MLIVRLIGIQGQEQIIAKIDKIYLDIKDSIIGLIGTDGTKYIVKIPKRNVRKTYETMIDDLFVQRKTTITCEGFEKITTAVKKEKYKHFYLEDGEWKER